MAVIDKLIGVASWLCVLARDAADADDGATSAPDEDEGEREDKTDFCRYVLACAGVKGLCAVAGMDEEGIVALDLNKKATETVDLKWMVLVGPRRLWINSYLGRGDERRERGNAGLDAGSVEVVWIRDGVGHDGMIASYKYGREGRMKTGYVCRARSTKPCPGDGEPSGVHCAQPVC